MSMCLTVFEDYLCNQVLVKIIPHLFYITIGLAFVLTLWLHSSRHFYERMLHLTLRKINLKVKVTITFKALNVSFLQWLLCTNLNLITLQINNMSLRKAMFLLGPSWVTGSCWGQDYKWSLLMWTRTRTTCPWSVSKITTTKKKTTPTKKSTLSGKMQNYTG